MPEHTIIETGTKQDFKRCLLYSVVAIRFTKCGHVAILQYETVANWGTKEPLADLLTTGRLEGYCGDCTRHAASFARRL